MTQRGHKLTKGLFVSMLLTLTIALGGCAGDKAEQGSTQIATTPATESGSESSETSENNTEVSSQTPETTGDVASQITIGIPQDLNSLDPNLAEGSGTQEILFNIYEGLYKPDSNGNLLPAVASGYTMSEDGLVYTFTLRDGIKFHDGNPVTVADVKYSIEKCAGMNGGEPIISAFKNIESVETPDDSTIVVTLKEASSIFVAICAEPAHIKDITLKVIADADSIVMNLEGGAVDMIARVSTAQAAELSDKFEILEGTMNLVQAVYLNNTKAPFDNELVRKALCYATNKQEIMDFVSEGKGTTVGSSMFPVFGKYYMEELNNTYPTDIEKAKELLTEAGYSDGFTFTMKVPSNYQQHVDTAQVLVEQYKQIGVTANIELIEWETWLSDVYQGRDFEATVVGVDASTLTAGAMLSRFRSDSHNNFINYSNAEYDAAYNNALAAEAVMDDDGATNYYKECETILTNTAANVYIQDMCELVAISKKYAGYEFYPLYIQDFSKLYLAE